MRDHESAAMSGGVPGVGGMVSVGIGVVRKEGRYGAAEFCAGGATTLSTTISGEGADGKMGNFSGGMGASDKTGAEAAVAAGVEGGGGATAGGEGNTVLGEMDVRQLLAVREMERLAEVERRLREGKTVTDREAAALARSVEARERAVRENVSGTGEKRGTEIEAAVGEDGLHAWWVNGGGDAGFHVYQENQWLEVGERTLRLMLKRCGVTDETERGEVLTASERAILYVREHRTLDKVAEGIAGYKKGVYEVGGRRTLVQKEARLMVPVKGDCAWLENWIAERLALEGADGKMDMVQYYRFCYWLKRAVQNLYESPGSWLNSQVLILAGKAGCGKSQLQHRIITPLLGGRKADPSKYLFGGTQFNEGWIGCEHLLVEDPRPSTKMLDRLQLAQILKSLAVNEQHTLEAKHRGEFAVDPQFVVTVSINDDPDALRILPMLTPDFADKVMLLHLQKRDFDMPTGTDGERKAFRERIEAELPAFLHWLLFELEVPEELRDERFGVREYHHPELRMSLWEESPSAELLALVDSVQWRIGEGTMSAGRRGFFEMGGAGPGVSVAREWKWLVSCEAGSGQMGREKQLRWTLQKGTAHGEFVRQAVEAGYRLWVGRPKDLEALLEECERPGVRKWLAHNPVGRALSRLAEDAPERVCRYRHGHNGDRYLILRSAGVWEDDGGAAEMEMEARGGETMNEWGVEG